MSRVGKMPLAVPQGRRRDVVRRRTISVKGSLGTLVRPVNRAGHGQERRRQADVRARPTTRVEADAMSGTMRALVANMVGGVTKGFREEAQRWSASAFAPAAQGSKLNLQIGFSHPVSKEMPGRRQGASARRQTEIVIKGPTARRSARSPPKCARCARPSPTRARASATPTRRSSIKETKKK